MTSGSESLFSLVREAGPFKLTPEGEAALAGIEDALRAVRADSQQLVGMEDPFGSQGPPILVGANAYFALVAALGHLTQEEARRA